MKRRYILPGAMAAIGSILLLAAGFASSADARRSTSAGPAAAEQAERRGGTLRVDLVSDFDYIDPALAYFSHSWQLGNAIHLKLLSHPDKEGAAGSRMVPQAAAGFPAVSRDGKTYTFRIKQGFRFSNGQPVTAASFARAFQRALSPRMQSPAKSFLDDVRSYRAVNATTFRVTLKVVAPDFLARMTMPFFAAVPANLPLNPQGVGAPLVSAGPYYVREWNTGQSAIAVRNPYWNNAKAPWKALGRPANVDQIRWAVGITPANQRLRLEANQSDMGTFPPAQAKELSDKYGLNKGRFFVRKNMVFWYLSLNNEQPLFRNNVKLRQAVNHALARPYLVAQHGYLGGGRTDQILPPGMPGFRDANIYSLKGANLTRANQLARGNTRGGKAVFYAFNTSFGPPVAQAVQFSLKQIGLDVDIQQYDRVVQHEKAATRGEKFDITHEGWGADYPDPSNFMNVLLDGRRLQSDHNPNTSYFNDPKYNRKLEAAVRLSGAKRLSTYGALDAEIMRDAAPMAPYVNTNARILVSQELGCFNYSNVNSAVNLVGVCKK